ncbi:MAG: YegS/Rv2252/BmrU family lipid kinase [Clostridiales bacterium]|nr:YegS/Rv2252/BmrU family lipid kinase [Clostridiales bacterium]
MSKKLLFIVNLHAGKTKSRAPLFDAISIFSAAGYLVSVQLTNGVGDARRFAREMGDDFDLVVCSGGDGTLNETISGLMLLPQRPPVGYLPNGSTNDFAASLQISSNPTAAAEAIAKWRIRTLDVGAHNDRFFAYVASFGAFTKTSYSAPQSAKNALGHLAYILEGMKDLDTLRPYCCRVEADGESFEGEFIFGAVCNTTSLGGLVRLDPSHVILDDGKFEMLLLQMPKTALALQNLIIALMHQQYSAPGVIFRHVSHVTVITGDHIPWSLDGEFAPSAPVVTISNIHQGISLLL